MLDISAAMVKLAERRPIFHSEADFQHEFAWAARESIPGVEVRLEHRLHHANNAAVDILLRNNGSVIAVELKYLCRQLSVTLGNDNFILRQQGAHDIRRYDVLKDVARMEELVSRIPHAQALVVVLTNDPAFWRGPVSKNTCDAAFSLREGRSVTGSLNWSDQTGAGTKRNRESSILLANKYEFSWRDYSTVSSKAGVFRYMNVNVNPPSS